LLVLILVAVAAGCAAGFAAWRYPRLSAGSPAPAFSAARKAGEVAAEHSRLRGALASRLDPNAATGLALTLALFVTMAGGVGLGPSFPSGPSATAAAVYAGAALLLGRRRSHATRATLTGLAVGIAVAVASSRVLLDVHWLSDVIAGLLLGWAWFAACGIAF